jgi:hypothetical protein
MRLEKLGGLGFRGVFGFAHGDRDEKGKSAILLPTLRRHSL